MAQINTKEFVLIEDIRDNTVIMKNGSLRSVVEIGAVNFELKSEDEQTAMIQRFQDFLNSLDFPVQIAIVSRKLKVKNYMDQLDQITNSQTNELLRIQAFEYARFIKSLTELSNIMSKKFYIIVPFYTPIISQKNGILKGFKSILKPKETIKGLGDEEFNNYKIQLEQRVNLVLDNIANVGLSAKQLEKDALVNLFYQIYNPGSEMTLVYE